MRWRKGTSEDDEEHFAFEESAAQTHEPVQEEMTPEPSQPVVSKRRRRSRVDDEEEAEEKGVLKRVTRSEEVSWLNRHWKTLVILFFIFGLALFFRAYYGVEPSTENGFLLSGGSDSYYHDYVINHAIDTGDHHFWDGMINYPQGSRNPRPPLFDWSVVMGGIGASPFFGSMEASVFYVFLFSTAFWGALTIFPAYFLAKEAFGRKTGIVAAFLLAIMPGHVTRSVWSNADHDAMALFFIVTAFFFFLRALKVLDQRKWVDKWRSPSSILGGIRGMIGANTISFLYAVMAALSITAVALIWKGYAYAIVILTIYFFIQVLINRFRGSDSMAILFVYLITVGLTLLLVFPYYYQSVQIKSWYDAPVYMFLGASIFALVLIVTNKYPWILVFSSMIFLAVLVISILYFAAPALLDVINDTLMSGAGYFVSNKQYETIAEAQAPPFSNLALSFGAVTFWLSFVGVAWAAVQLPKNLKAEFIFILLWTATSIYMAVTAARFMFNAAPAFAITAGWVVAILIDKLDIRKFSDQMKRVTTPKPSRGFSLGIVGAVVLLVIVTIGLSSDADLALSVLVIGITTIVGALLMNLIAETNPKKMYHLIAILIPIAGASFYLYAVLGTDLKLTPSTHGFVFFVLMFLYFVLYLTVRRTKISFTAGVLFLAFFIVVPNVWAGLDAGIPYETKRNYDEEIYDVMPTFLRPSDYNNQSNWYIGGFGYSMPLNNRYWPAAYDWLATQDSDIYPADERPAFLSWWDYGFEAVNEGKHPTVADNFLGGHQLAGNFIMAQSEEDAIALLATRIIEGDYGHFRKLLAGNTGLSDEVKAVLLNHNFNTDKVVHMLENPTEYIDEIKIHPEIYSPRDDFIQAKNARYLIIRGLITETLEKEEVVSLYQDLREATGYSIRYFAIDSRMFPFSADNTGIFYAPAKLSDHRIGDIGNQPYDFWEIKFVDDVGNVYPLDEIPPDVKPHPENPYKIEYKEMFFNTMLYKAFIGFSPMDIGQDIDSGIPGLSGEMASNKIMPGWNMTHFKLVHRTAYWNPYSPEEVRNHTEAWQAMNFYDALALQNDPDTEGVADTSDRSSLYQGVMMLKYYDGAIISGQVMLEDGTPVNGARVTVSDDYYIPHHVVYSDEDGSYTAIAPFGDVTITVSTSAMNPITLIGGELNITQMFIEDYQAMREDVDKDSDGKPDYLIDLSPVIGSGSLSGTVYWDVDGDGIRGENDVLIPNAEIRFSNKHLIMDAVAHTNETGMYSSEFLAPGDQDVKIYLAGQQLQYNQQGDSPVTVTSGQERTHDFGVTPSRLGGFVMFPGGNPAIQAKISAWMPDEDIHVTTYTNETGSYFFDTLLQGTYHVQASLDIDYATTGLSFASAITRVDIFGSNNTLNLQLHTSSNISGTVSLKDGTPVPNTNIRFIGQIDSIVLTNDSGHFYISLADGQYDVISEYTKGSRNYISYISEHEINGDQNLDIILDYGTKVFGRVTLDSDFGAVDAKNVEISFENMDSGVEIKTHTNNQGTYTILVPQGQYHVQISVFLNSVDYTYYATKSFTDYSKEFDMLLAKALLVQGTVAWDIGVGFAEKIGLEGAIISFRDTTGNKFIAKTGNENGLFIARLHLNMNYATTISKPGFIELDLGSMTAEELSLERINEELTPLSFPVSGTILMMNEEPVTGQDIMLYFTGNNRGAESRSVRINEGDGTYSVDLVPGEYTVSFSQNVTPGDDTYVHQIAEEVTFDTGFYTGTPLVLDLGMRERVKTHLDVFSPYSVTSNVTFEGPETRTFVCDNGKGTYHLMPGDYVLSASYAYNETIWLGMKSVSIGLEESTVNVSIDDGFSLHGILAYGAKKMPYQEITFKHQSGGEITAISDASAEYDVALPPNSTYQILVDFVSFDDDEKPYRYFINETFTVVETTSPAHSIDLSKEEFYTSVSGAITLEDGTSAGFATITFFSPLENAELVADDLGNFKTELRPGAYSVYVHHANTHEVYLETIDIGTDPSTALNMSLIPGYKLSGTTYYNLNKHQITLLDFTSSSGTTIVSSDSEGFYQIWLPPDYYNVTGESETIEKGLNMTYELDSSFTLESGKLLNLPMSLIEEPSVELYWDSAQRAKLYPGQNVTYTIKVNNTGNVLETYSIYTSGGDSNWDVKFGNEVSIDLTISPGTTSNSKTIKLTIKTSTDSEVNFNALAVNAVSSRNPESKGTVNLFLDIWQDYGLEMEESVTSPKFDQGQIKWEFDAINTGNGRDEVELYIANQEDLRKNGWSARFGTIGADAGDMESNNTRITNFTINSGGAGKVPIILTPVGDTTSAIANVFIVGHSQGDSSVSTSKYLTLRYPELSIYSSDVTITGEGVHDQPLGDQATNASVMMVTVAAALILFYVSRKRRWIR